MSLKVAHINTDKIIKQNQIKEFADILEEKWNRREIKRLSKKYGFDVEQWLESQTIKPIGQ